MAHNVVTRRDWGRAPACLDTPPSSPPCGRALLVSLAIGLFGLAADHLHWSQPKVGNLHLLFGTVLITTVGCCVQVAGRRGLDAVCYNRYARQVYLLLYVLAAVRLSLAVLAGRADADHLDLLTHLARDDSLADFQIYLGSGCAAVLLIRMAAGFRKQRRCVPSAR